MWRIISPSSCKDSAKVLQDYMNDAHPISHLIKINWGNSRLSLSNPVEVWGNKKLLPVVQIRHDFSLS